jgi:AcrR family transcriptional regulator
MAPPPDGLRERKKTATRLAIARAAMALFEERGYDGTTVEDIATAANVSRRTFFRYFAGKDEVLIVDPEGKLRALHVDIDRDPRPRIVAHATVAIMRAGVASWLGDGGHGEPADAVARTFDLTTPALEAVLAMPVSQPAARRRRSVKEPARRS